MNLRDHILLFILGLVLFVPFLGHVHLFDWDEINFAESAREMMITGNWFQVQINFQPFWEKPPLFFWMQVLSMKTFGVNEFAARFPNALAGILTLQVFYVIGTRHHGRDFGILWALLYVGSFLPHLYFKSGIIDPWFNLFIFLSIYFLYLIIEGKPYGRFKYAIAAGIFSGLAILTKGPVGFLLFLLTFLTWWVWSRFKRPASLGVIATYALVAAAVTLLWFGLETIQNGPWFLVEFITYQIDLFLNPVAGHKQPFYYHFLVVLLGCFPLSVFALPTFGKNFKGDHDRLSLWMKFIFWVVMILFSIATTKIVHYSSMAYLPLSYLAALFVHERIHARERLPKWQLRWVGIQGGVIAFALFAVPLLIQFRSLWIGYVKDPFVIGNLEATIDGFGGEWLVGLVFGLVLILGLRTMKRQLHSGVRILSNGTALTIFLTMPLIVPIIESISQRSAIAFFEAQQGKDVYIETYGYKSYAHYFYGRIQPATSHEMDEHTLVAHDKPIMVSVKVNRLERFTKEYPEATFLYEAGGFHFFKIR